MDESKTEAAPRRTAPEREAPRAGNALDEAFESFTGSLGGGQPRKLPQREVSFTVDASICAPGVFREDFTITLRSLTPSDELAAAQKSGGDPMKLALTMAMASIHAFDGKVLDQAKREFLWAALDQAGRNVVVSQFGALGSPGEDAMAKTLASLVVG